jgi:hypothetical protein
MTVASSKVDYGRGEKAQRVRRVVHELLLSKRAAGEISTNGRFVFYELEQRGDAVKPSPSDSRPNKRRSRGWPPGGQDVTDALTWLRVQGIVPWWWIKDETRQLVQWAHARSVADYLLDRLPEATISPWGDESPPLILCESRATAGVLQKTVSPYCCPIAGLSGQVAGFLHVEIAPVLVQRRPVLYLGDLDKAGNDIEENTRRVLEHDLGRSLDWHRLAMTGAQAEGIEPIYKQDGRDKQWREAWEVESLGQRALVELVREELDARLPEPLDHVQEREDEQREAWARRLNGGPA